MQADTAHVQAARTVHTTHAQLFASCHREPTTYDGSLVSVSFFVFLATLRSFPVSDPERWRRFPLDCLKYPKVGWFPAVVTHIQRCDLPIGEGQLEQ